MQIPDYCEALIGYRVWRVAEGGLLTGVHICEPWAPKVAHRASCQKRYGSSYQGYAYGDVEHSPHLAKGRFVPAPVLTCFCGLWGTRTEADLFEAADSPEAPSTIGFAWGSVSLWGRVIEHTNGWRAEFAYPKALKATSEAAQIAALYGVPCEAVKVAPRKKSLDDELGWFIGPRFVKGNNILDGGNPLPSVYPATAGFCTVGLALLFGALAFVIVWHRNIGMQFQKIAPRVLQASLETPQQNVTARAWSREIPSEQLALVITERVNEIDRSDNFHFHALSCGPVAGHVSFNKVKQLWMFVIWGQWLLAEHDIQRVAGIGQDYDPRERQRPFGAIGKNELQARAAGPHFKLELANVNPLAIQNLQCIGGLLRRTRAHLSGFCGPLRGRESKGGRYDLQSTDDNQPYRENRYPIIRLSDPIICRFLTIGAFAFFLSFLGAFFGSSDRHINRRLGYGLILFGGLVFGLNGLWLLGWL